jgi:hypothetical protein
MPEAAVDQSRLLKLINLPIEIINRYLARRPLIEIHRLAWAVPGSQSRAEDIRRLFGDVQ